MIANRSPFVLFPALCLLAACAAPAPEPVPVESALSPPVRDRTIYDGLDAARAAAVETAPPERAAPPRAPRPVAERPAPRVATVSGLTFVDEPLDEAIKRLQLVTGAPILITPKGRAVIADEGVTIDLELTAPVRLHNVLDLFVQQSDDLGWKVDDGVIWITTKSDARGPMQLQMYDVRDLLMARPNFPAPRIQGLPTGEEAYGYAEPPEPTRMIDPDQLIDLIRNATGPDYWEETDGASMEVTDNGLLLVRADARMQRRIGAAVRLQR